MRRMMTGWLLMLLVGMASAATYEETFTAKAGKAYSEDINIWVYTSEFAKRFGMPEAWVDDDLKGAYGVAFRVEYASGRTMFPHKGPEVSMPNHRCILDIYVPSDAPIPWKDDQIADFWLYTPTSAAYVLPQSREDLAWRWQSVGIESPGKKARKPLIYFGQVGNDKRGSLFVREYDKAVYPGVSYISFMRGCWGVGQVAYRLDFLKDSETLRDNYGQSDIAYGIKIPEQYMKRVYQNWNERIGKGDAKRWQKIIEGNPETIQGE